MVVLSVFGLVVQQDVELVVAQYALCATGFGEMHYQINHSRAVRASVGQVADEDKPVSKLPVDCVLLK